MQLKRRVALNGAQLDQVDSRIVISSVEPGDGKESITAVDAASGYGQRITSRRRSTLDMVVKFRILERGHSASGLQNRAEVLEKVNAWAAGGGLLTVNYKPDRQLRVILAQAPGEGSLWDYTKEFTITFRAYGVPYWEQVTPGSEVIDEGGSSGTEIVLIGGSAKTQADVTLENTSGSTVDTVSISVGDNTMSFSNLGLADDEILTIDHTDDGLVRIRILDTNDAYRDAMAKRDATSANDFMTAPGNTICAYEATGACTMTLIWRERYL